MRIAILFQEEPVFLSPFLREVIRLHPDRVAAVFPAGRRGAGERKGSVRELLESLRIFWLILEPWGFLKGLAVRVRSRLLGRFDPASIEGLARSLCIPVHPVSDPNSRDFHERLREIGPDVVLNQSELLLKREVLSIPRFGFLNRHASLLPAFRGRMAAFRAHAAEPPSYGLTIHQVDEGIDTGPIILQKEFPKIDPRWPYPRIMKQIMSEAPSLFWKATELLESPGFEPLTNTPVDKPYRFPTLEEVRAYRKVLGERRKESPRPAH